MCNRVDFICVNCHYFKYNLKLYGLHFLSSHLAPSAEEPPPPRVDPLDVGEVAGVPADVPAHVPRPGVHPRPVPLPGVVPQRHALTLPLAVILGQRLHVQAHPCPQPHLLH